MLPLEHLKIPEKPFVFLQEHVVYLLDLLKLVLQQLHSRLSVHRVPKNRRLLEVHLHLVPGLLDR